MKKFPGRYIAALIQLFIVAGFVYWIYLDGAFKAEFNPFLHGVFTLALIFGFPMLVLIYHSNAEKTKQNLPWLLIQTFLLFLLMAPACRFAWMSGWKSWESKMGYQNIHQQLSHIYLNAQKQYLDQDRGMYQLGEIEDIGTGWKPASGWVSYSKYEPIEEDPVSDHLHVQFGGGFYHYGYTLIKRHDQGKVFINLYRVTDGRKQSELLFSQPTNVVKEIEAVQERKR